MSKKCEPDAFDGICTEHYIPVEKCWETPTPIVSDVPNKCSYYPCENDAEPGINLCAAHTPVVSDVDELRNRLLTLKTDSGEHVISSLVANEPSKLHTLIDFITSYTHDRETEAEEIGRLKGMLSVLRNFHSIAPDEISDRIVGIEGALKATRKDGKKIWKLFNELTFPKREKNYKFCQGKLR